MSKKYKSESEQVDRAWNKLEPLLAADPVIQFRPAFKQRMVAAAAVLFLISMAGAWFMNDHYKEISYATNYGETFRITLPDSSVVVMNGNSKISYRKHWSDKVQREVKLDGEAYFSVKHTRSNQKFFVRMNDQSSVEVLGTEFNISKRGADTKVVLNSGKIKFNLTSGYDTADKSLIMKPGDMVEYRSDHKTLTKKVVDPDIYSSWKSFRLAFDKTSLREVMNIIHETYGLKIIVKDPALLDMKVSGSAPSQNIDKLIEGLSEIFELDLIRHGDTIIVSPTNQIHNQTKPK
jgi:transmembrane sensor